MRSAAAGGQVPVKAESDHGIAATKTVEVQNPNP
jgi:hypothetical protein